MSVVRVQGPVLWTSRILLGLPQGKRKTFQAIGTSGNQTGLGGWSGPAGTQRWFLSAAASEGSPLRETLRGYGFPGSGVGEGIAGAKEDWLERGTVLRVRCAPAASPGLRPQEGRPESSTCSTSPSSSSRLWTLSLELTACFTFSYIYGIKHCFLVLIFKVSKLCYTVLTVSLL